MLYPLAVTAAPMAHAECLRTSPGNVEMAQHTLDRQIATILKTIAVLIAIRLLHGLALEEGPSSSDLSWYEVRWNCHLFGRRVSRG